MPRFSLKRHEKIKKSADFISVYKRGLKKESLHFKITFLANDLPWSRLGITVSRKAGCSVRRNYIKRCVREYFRLHKSRFPGACDIVLTAKPGAGLLKYADMAGEFDALLHKDGNDRSLNADA